MKKDGLYKPPLVYILIIFILLSPEIKVLIVTKYGTMTKIKTLINSNHLDFSLESASPPSDILKLGQSMILDRARPKTDIVCNNKPDFEEIIERANDYRYHLSKKKHRQHMDQNLADQVFGDLFIKAHYIPQNCTAKSKVAILVPFRGSDPPDFKWGRDYQLELFLYFMTNFLIAQNIEFKIYVIEQAQTVTFNRAKLLNIGFLEAMKDFDWECLVLHDVDRIPSNVKLDYNCLNTRQIKHYMPNPGGLAAVAQITPQTIEKINGFSNLYFGWGGEDQEMFKRVLEGRIIAKKRIKTMMELANVSDSKYLDMNPFITFRPTQFSSVELKSGAGFWDAHFNRDKAQEKGNKGNKQRWNLLKKFKKMWPDDGLNLG